MRGALWCDNAVARWVCSPCIDAATDDQRDTQGSAQSTRRDVRSSDVTTHRSTTHHWSATSSHWAAATSSRHQASLIDAQSHHPCALSMGCESLYASGRCDACGPTPSTTAACQSSGACHPPTTGGRYRREAALCRGDQSQRARRKSETVGCRRQYGRPTRRFSIRRPRRRTGPPTTTSNARMDNRAGPVASRWTTCASHGSADKRGADHSRSHWLALTLTG